MTWAGRQDSGQNPGQTLQGPQQTELSRDFTYVDDIVEGVIASLTHIPPSKPGSAQYKVR